MDGVVGGWVCFCFVIWFMLVFVMIFVVVIFGICFFQVFDIVYVLIKGGLLKFIEVLIYIMYMEGFEFFCLGYVVVIMVVFLVFIFVFMLVKVWFVDCGGYVI